MKKRFYDLRFCGLLRGNKQTLIHPWGALNTTWGGNIRSASNSFLAAFCHFLKSPSNFSSLSLSNGAPPLSSLQGSNPRAHEPHLQARVLHLIRHPGTNQCISFPNLVCLLNLNRQNPNPSFFCSFKRAEGGLFVDMSSFLAFGKDYVAWNYEKTGNPVYLHIQQQKKPVPEDRPLKKPTLLATGIC